MEEVRLSLFNLKCNLGILSLKGLGKATNLG